MSTIRPRTPSRRTTRTPGKPPASTPDIATPTPAPATSGGTNRLATFSGTTPHNPLPSPSSGGAPAGSTAARFNLSRALPGEGTRLLGFSSPMMNPAGRVVFPWDKPGDTIPLELTVEVTGDRSRVRAEVWTNANHNGDPATFEAVAMKEVRSDGNRVTYRVDLPITHVGNYRAAPRVSTDGGATFRWGADNGIPDIRFRPHVEAHDALNMMEVNINNVNGGRGTLADMMGAGSPETNGKYTLEALAKDGYNSVWVMPPFKRSVWDYRHPLDDAGSPYAAKDYFAVDPNLSQKAMALAAQGRPQEEVDQAATDEFKGFVSRAHGLGQKVIVDVALNHVGHNFEFKDLFSRYDAAGKEVREVRRNDFSNVAVNAGQLEVIKNRLADPKLPSYMEYVAPWMYASADGNPAGAQSANQVMAGGAQWFDTKQLFTGGTYGGKNAAQNEAVIGWLGRVLEYWAVDMGVDGFRLDHLQGLPQSILESALNRAQAAVDRHRPGVQLYFTGEDFAAPEFNASYLDNIQDTWLRNELMASSSAGKLREVLSNPYFANREMLNINSHDESRFDFHGDMKAAARMESLLPLLGGTSMHVAGDEYGEAYQMPFKQYRPVGSIQTPSPAGEDISERIRRAGGARRGEPALQDDNRAFLDPRVGGADADLLALSRFPDADKQGSVVLVFANFNNGMARENAFGLDGQTRSRLKPDQRYQVFDLMGDNPKAPLWNPPLTGRELMEKGLFVRLSPYQVQALKLEEAP
jgi:hypothetical protein